MTDQCKDIFLEKNISQFSKSTFLQTSSMQLMSEEFYNANKRDIEGSYEFTGGSYSEFQEELRRRNSSLFESLNSSEAISALTLSSLPGTAEAWAQCMAARKSELFCWLEGEPDEAGFTLMIEWAPPNGLGGNPLLNLSGYVMRGNGHQSAIKGLPTSMPPGRMPIAIDREGEVSVRGGIHGDCGTNRFAATFFAPYSDPIVETDLRLAEHPELLLSQDNVHGGLQFGQTYWSPFRLFIGDTDFSGNAILEHAPLNGKAQATFRIPRGARYFSTYVGLARQDTTNGSGDVTARVFVDDSLAWEHRVFGPQQSGSIKRSHPIGLPAGARLLRLESDSNGDNNSDHLAWADPQFTTWPGGRRNDLSANSRLNNEK